MKRNWRKSSYSSAQGNCAEIASDGRRILVRDTKYRAEVVLKFSPDAWRNFAEQVKHSLGNKEYQSQVR